MAEHRWWLHPLSHMPANHYERLRVAGVIYLLKKNAPSRSAPYLRKARSPPDDSDQKA
jgi:hypothetical protein